MPSIQINKLDGKRNDVYKEPETKAKTEEMSEKMSEICDYFFEASNSFKEEKAFDSLLFYIGKYQRILYSEISSQIYACYEKNEAKEADIRLGTLLSNIQKIVQYNSSEKYQHKKEKIKKQSEIEMYEDCEKALIKIYDHVNLAVAQYGGLKQTDKEYKEKFEASIVPFKEELEKEMNAQLLTMVSIFTALAFLVFGGISSLGSIFSNSEIPVLKVIIIGSVWGLGILNMIFIFLFCVGKMAGLNFKSTQDGNANIIQKYPIVWWSDLIIVTIFALGLWSYYIRKENIDSWFKILSNKYPEVVMMGGFIIIIVLFICGWRALFKTTKKKV